VETWCPSMNSVPEDKEPDDQNPAVRHVTGRPFANGSEDRNAGDASWKYGDDEPNDGNESHATGNDESHATRNDESHATGDDDES
jgi:hypothetical protein